MKFKVYEYTIKNGKKSYLGSYTLREGCSKEQELQKKFNSKLVKNQDYKY